MLVSHAGYAVKEGRKHAGPQPQKWVRVPRKPKRNVSKGAGMPVLFCSKHDCHKQCKDMRTASGSVQNPAAQPPAPPNIKVGLITSALCRKQLHHERQQDWLL